MTRLFLTFLLSSVLIAQQTRLQPSQIFPEDEFGFSVSIDEAIVAIGAPGRDAGADLTGAAHIFELIENDWGETAILTASDFAENDFFGGAISVHEQRIAIGAQGKSDVGVGSGAVYVFENTESGWLETQKITASDPTNGALFGFSVALNEDWLLVGALRDEHGSVSNGSIYFFQYDSIGETWVERQKLNAADGHFEDEYAATLALDDSVAIVGAPTDDDDGPRSGSVYTYSQNQNGFWEFDQKLRAGDASDNQWFGQAVALTGEAILVGAPFAEGNVGSSGAVYMFTVEAGEWIQHAKLVSPHLQGEIQFGGSVAFHSNGILAGVPAFMQLSGSVRRFDKQVDILEATVSYAADDAQPFSTFGSSLAVSANLAVVGAPNDNTAGFAAGAAHIIELNNYPYIISEAQTSAVVDSLYMYQLDLFDPEADSLTVTLISGPEFLTLMDSALTGVPASAGIFDVSLLVSDPDGHSTAQQFELIVESGMSLQADSQPPASFYHSAYPNPFNNTITIRYSLRTVAEVWLTIYDIHGKPVTVLLAGNRQLVGSHRATWDGTDVSGTPVASGVYIMHLSAGSEASLAQKLILIK